MATTSREKIAELIIHDETCLKDGLKSMDQAGFGLLLVVNKAMQLIGILTDGDVRRSLIQGKTLDCRITEVMNKEFEFWPQEKSRKAALAHLRSLRCSHLPVLNKDRRVVDIICRDNEILFNRETTVVFMVGGLGTRLRPLTDRTPKPMLPVGEKPMLERLLESFIEQGFYRFYFCVNYLAEQIVEYFQDGKKWSADIKYIHEKARMGTAGALSLLNYKSEKPLIIMNGDLQCDVDFGKLLDYHVAQKNAATMCVKHYQYQIPFGVISTSGQQIIKIEEKPVHDALVNAGIYIINPLCLKYIPKKQFFDMPEFFNKLMEIKLRTGCFPIHEQWMDIGRMDDYEQLKKKYEVD